MFVSWMSVYKHDHHKYVFAVSDGISFNVRGDLLFLFVCRDE